MATAEQITIIRSSLDPSGYTQGAAAVVAANQKIAASGDGVVQTTTKATRALTDGGAAFDRYRQNADKIYQATLQLQKVQDAATRARQADNADIGAINQTLGVYQQRLTDVTRAYVTLGSGADKAQVSMRDLSAAMREVDQAADSAAARTAALIQKFDPATASAQRMVAELRDLNAAQNAGIAIAGGYSNAYAAIVGQYDEGAKAAKAAAAAQADLLAQARAANQASGAQNQFNSILGVADPAASSGSARASAAVFEAQAAAAKRLAETYGDLRSSVDPVFAASKQYEADLAKVTAALDANLISEKQAAQLRDLTTASFAKSNAPMNDLAGSTKSVGFAMRDLGLQSIDLFQGLATGQPVFRTLIQQGSQVVQVNAAMGVGFKQTMQGVLGLVAGINPLILVGGAVVVALGAMAVSAESNQRSLLALQNSLRATRDDYASMAAEATAAAKAVAASSGFSGADTRSAALAFTSQQNFTGTTAQLQELLRVAGDAATILGVTLPEEAKTLAEAMADPAKAVQDMADKHLFGFNQALATTIERMANSGDKAGAFGAIIDQLRAKVQGAEKDALTPLGQGLQDIANAFASSGDHGKSWSQEIGENIVNNLGAALSTMAKLIQAAKDLNNLVGGPGAEQTLADIKRQGVVMNPAKPMGSAADMIASLGAQGNVPSDQIAFAQRVAMQESGGRQYNAFGGVLTSSAGGQGIMGLMPPTAAGLGVDATNPQQNVAGGLLYISQLWQKYGGDPGLVAMAYNWGPGNVDAFLSGTKTLAQVPKETQNYVKSVAGVDVSSLHAQGNVASIDISGSSTFGTSNTSLVNDATTAAKAAGTSVSDWQKAHDAVLQYSAALNVMRASGTASASDMAMVSEALQKAQVAEYNAIGPAQSATRAIDDQTKAAKQIGDAYSGGYAAVQQATIHTQAYEAALKIASPTAANFGSIVDALTNSYTKLTAQQQDNQAKAEALDQGQQLQYLQAESATLGESADQRERDLAALKERQAIEKTMPGLAEDEKAALIANAAAISDATAQYQHQQQALQEIGNMVTQIADQVGNALTQAFISGQGAAVNFGNVARGILASIVQEIAKLAIINPILNSVTGSANTTLGGVLSAVGSVSGSGSSGGGTSALGLLQNVGGLATNSSLLDTLGFGNIGSQLGLTGQGGILSNLGLNGVSSGITGFLNTGTGIGINSAAFGPVTSGLPSGGAGLGGATIGQFAGGIGLGYGAGSLAGGLIQGGLNKTGPAPQIGAGVGALTGAAIGSIIPGVGTVIGGLVGGLIGGGGGGFIGPHPASPYTTEQITVDANGRLGMGRTDHQITDNAAEIAQAQSDIDNINNYLDSVGLKISNTRNAAAGFASEGAIFQIGSGGPAAQGDLAKYGSLDAGFGSLQFSSGDAKLDSLVNGKTFANFADLQNEVNAYKTAQQSIMDFISTTSPALKNLGTVSGTLNDQLASLNAQFDAATNAAEQLRTSQYATANQAADLAQQEIDLAAARQKAIQAANDAAAQALLTTNAGFTARYDSALGTLNSDPALQQQSALEAFDVQAQQQRDQLSASLVATYGDTIKSTQSYTDEMAFLERTLGAERLAVQKQYNDQITASAQQAATAAAQAAQQAQDQASQSATSVVTSITSYLQKLQTGSQSALSPTAQYALASNQFNAVRGAAQAGDFTSISQLTSYADALLQTSRNVNGSGAQYASDFQRVLDAVSSVANMSDQQLTSDAMASISQTQTQTLVAALKDVQNEVKSLTAEVRQGNAQPAKRAA